MLGLLTFVIFVIGLPVIIYQMLQTLKKIPQSKKSLSIVLFFVGALTGGYLFWESQASGNIRVDLLFIYPCLLVGYALLLWRHLKWFSLLASVLLMLFNFWFMSHSYQWFHKFPG